MVLLERGKGKKGSVQGGKTLGQGRAGSSAWAFSFTITSFLVWGGRKSFIMVPDVGGGGSPGTNTKEPRSLSTTVISMKR